MPYKDPAKRSEASRKRFLAYQRRYSTTPVGKANRRRWKLKRHGWTLEMLVQTMREQGERCAICRLPMNPPNADHRHVTPPEPRGVLCNGCNFGIGFLKESPDLCRAAADYLEAWS